MSYRKSCENVGNMFCGGFYIWPTSNLSQNNVRKLHNFQQIICAKLISGQLCHKDITPNAKMCTNCFLLKLPSMRFPMADFCEFLSNSLTESHNYYTRCKRKICYHNKIKQSNAWQMLFFCLAAPYHCLWLHWYGSIQNLATLFSKHLIGVVLSKARETKTSLHQTVCARYCFMERIVCEQQ